MIPYSTAFETIGTLVGNDEMTVSASCADYHVPANTVYAFTKQLANTQAVEFALSVACGGPNQWWLFGIPFDEFPYAISRRWGILRDFPSNGQGGSSRVRIRYKGRASSFGGRGNVPTGGTQVTTTRPNPPTIIIPTVPSIYPPQDFTDIVLDLIPIPITDIYPVTEDGGTTKGDGVLDGSNVTGDGDVLPPSGGETGGGDGGIVIEDSYIITNPDGSSSLVIVTNPDTIPDDGITTIIVNPASGGSTGGSSTPIVIGPINGGITPDGDGIIAITLPNGALGPASGGTVTIGRGSSSGASASSGGGGTSGSITIRNGGSWPSVTVECKSTRRVGGTMTGFSPFLPEAPGECARYGGWSYSQYVHDVYQAPSGYGPNGECLNLGDCQNGGSFTDTTQDFELSFSYPDTGGYTTWPEVYISCAGTENRTTGGTVSFPPPAGASLSATSASFTTSSTSTCGVLGNPSSSTQDRTFSWSLTDPITPDNVGGTEEGTLCCAKDSGITGCSVGEKVEVTLKVKFKGQRTTYGTGPWKVTLKFSDNSTATVSGVFLDMNGEASYDVSVPTPAVGAPQICFSSTADNAIDVGFLNLN